MTADKLAVAHQMRDAGEYDAAAIANTIGVSRATLFRHLEQHRE